MVRKLKGFAPRHGVDCSPEYVNGYRSSHLGEETPEYRLSYMHVIVMDALLKDYSLLDIGCGTAGYYRLARNFRTFTGIDYSPRMLDAARDLAEHNGYADKSRFVNTTLENFTERATYDVVRVGVYGSYDPIDAALLGRLKRLLNPGGFLVLGISPPRGWRQKLRDLLGLPAIKMSESRFERLISRAGDLEIASRIRIRSRVYCFVQATR